MPQKQKIGAEEKIKIVRRYLNLSGEISLKEASRIVGVCKTTILRWIKPLQSRRICGVLAWRKEPSVQPENEAGSREDISDRRREPAGNLRKI